MTTQRQCTLPRCKKSISVGSIITGCRLIIPMWIVVDRGRPSHAVRNSDVLEVLITLQKVNNERSGVPLHFRFEACSRLG
ncbi:hypothetical protein, partial [Thermogutta sp.]|uniref:hypothetical protein n=1 Tax=Thermogutta sp. TaxID=1962930 RepID=UPI0025E8D07E